ncbi:MULTISPECIES: hypothetical protein [unclassified Moorena]|uniref:hypothetical protein n=1 Tax=unclassified Moorena TaxID=2683338 RepID=UPI0013C0AA54|nr:MULTISPECIES: hypothetical protein [unclassified Moorena]NEO45681.1 hypothetical protein [Moorena sp. SIO4A3]NEO05839.1 hypothetical protein [Moorena sp. SIO3I8]NEO20212.1 hypothetical protein [Moorena sp. SIO4A5]NEP22659.1 hypothetical protein [Moorena sp. SIO3I6]NEQ61251.1 hypothetical protein [Moorena sp. SIO4A1]
MGRWGDGEMGRWGDGEMEKILIKDNYRDIIFRYTAVFNISYSEICYSLSTFSQQSTK